MLSCVAAFSLMTAFANGESILMTEVFVIPIRPETFDWSGDGKKRGREKRVTRSRTMTPMRDHLHVVCIAFVSRKRYGYAQEPWNDEHTEITEPRESGVTPDGRQFSVIYPLTRFISWKLKRAIRTAFRIAIGFTVPRTAVLRPHSWRCHVCADILLTQRHRETV